MRELKSIPCIITLFLLSGCAALSPLQRPSLEGRNLMLWMPGASSVQVLADWNEWGGLESPGGVIDPTAGEMHRDESGYWILDISQLGGGSYRYVFLVNGHRWMVDPANPLTGTFKGSEVSLIMLSD